MYPIELISISKRCNHAPEFLIKKMMKDNINNIWIFLFCQLGFWLLFALGIFLINHSNTIIADILCVWCIVSATASAIILAVLSRNNILRTLHDNRTFSIECLIDEEREYQKNK